MNDFDALAQKGKGKLQKVKGRIQRNSGQGIKGGMAEIKGSLNDTIGSVKLDTNRQERREHLGEDVVDYDDDTDL